uniref:Uncharacterized protein n=1 Tax=Octopus bimaculoides TaxID=37653 RepID=A0A0L8GUI9_OCTBM
MSLWRNRLARSAVNRKVGGSSPPRDVDPFYIFISFKTARLVVRAHPGTWILFIVLFHLKPQGWWFEPTQGRGSFLYFYFISLFRYSSWFEPIQ